MTWLEAGVTLIETRTGAITVSTPDALEFIYVAEMLVVPCNRPDASPLVVTVATAGVEELHVADCVTSLVDPSL